MRINILITVGLLALFVSCNSGGKHNGTTENQTIADSAGKSVEINLEAKKLLSYLEENGDYVKGRNFPSIINPSVVYEELGNKISIIDLRNPDTFKQGHIEGAKNVQFSELPNYFNHIKPDEYDKIILVSYAGQISSYATSLLQLMGYKNVYSMKWGMSAWNKDFAANSWFVSVSGDFENKLELQEHDRAAVGDLPNNNTGKVSGEEIAQSRFEKVFEQGLSDVMISAKEVFEHPGKYYIINYDRRDKYESGHIPGAVRYRPNVTLGYVSEMQSIPTDKEVVVYCNTGQNSGFAVAYLRLLGYDAKSLTFGNNSFMYNKMLEEKNTLSWIPFTEAEIENYPYVKN